MKGVVVTTDNKIFVKDFSEPLYKSLNPVVGGYIEHVLPRGLPKPYCMIVNEEGLLLKLPQNRLGSYLYQTHIHGCPVVGNIVIMQDVFRDGGLDIDGIPSEKADAIVDWLTNRFDYLNKSPEN